MCGIGLEISRRGMEAIGIALQINIHMLQYYENQRHFGLTRTSLCIKFRGLFWNF